LNKVIQYIFFFIFLFYYNSSLAINIFVVDIDYIIENNPQYLKIISEIKKDQKKYLEYFEKEEQTFANQIKEFENSKLILDDAELNELIFDYNQNYQEFSLLVENYNNHYNDEISKIRNIILKKVFNLLETYARENNIDLLLDTDNYILASNSINITSDIEIKLNKIKFDLGFESFEKN
tara:strand:+ start:3692 stop:4228 length:537 start_codon:yes stop_codon:yes gene_type:complete